MKCKNCGGQYKTRELMCPYCSTENLLGKMWSFQRSEAELSYEEERKKVGKYMVSPYMINRILNRCLLVLGLLYVLLFLGVVLASGGESVYKYLKFWLNREKIESRMEQYYEEEEWALLDSYMEQNAVDGTKYYTYMQAVLLNCYYQEYMENRLLYESLSGDERENKAYYLEYAIKEAARVYYLDCGLYSEPDERNLSLYENYRQEILAYLIEELELTNEEIKQVKEGTYFE